MNHRDEPAWRRRRPATPAGWRTASSSPGSAPPDRRSTGTSGSCPSPAAYSTSRPVLGEGGDGNAAPLSDYRKADCRTGTRGDPAPASWVLPGRTGRSGGIPAHGWAASAPLALVGDEEQSGALLGAEFLGAGLAAEVVAD